MLLESAIYALSPTDYGLGMFCICLISYHMLEETGLHNLILMYFGHVVN